MTTSLQRNEPTWPFLLVLIALFLLSVTSPRAWRVVERPDPPSSQQSGRPAEMGTSRMPKIARAPSRPLEDLSARPGRSDPSPKPAGELEASGIHPQVAADVASGEPFPSEPLPQDDQPICRELMREAEEGMASSPDDRYEPFEEMALSQGSPPRPEGNSEMRAEQTDQHTPSPVRNQLWTPPESLLALLQPFAELPTTRDWVSRVREAISRLGDGFEKGQDVTANLEEIYRLAEESAGLQSQLDEQADTAYRFREVRYALLRRLSVWKALQLAGGLQVELARTTPEDLGRLETCLQKAEARLGAGPVAQRWREFLGLEGVQEVAAKMRREPSAGERELGELASHIVARVERQELNAEQEALLQEPPLAEYLDELRFWRASSIQGAVLLARIEGFESVGTHSAAEPLLVAYYRLSRSAEKPARWVARCLDILYRNANLRIAITAELLNRMVPERPMEQRPVADVILNRPVYGSSCAETKLGFRLLPDPRRARVALVVRGQVSSLTYATAGPATIWNDGFARYVAEKAVEITPRGLVTSPAVIDVQNSVRIREVSTQFDSIPVFGFLSQEVAREQASNRRLEASAEARWKLAARALQEIETEAEAQFAQLNRRWQSEVLAPLQRLRLTPTWLTSQTTEDRLVFRVRLAGAFQPGGHTLRPFAPADALASCQIHESMLNNFFQKLGLEGQTYTIGELQVKLRERLHLPEDDEREENPHADARVTFAAQDALRVQFRDGKLIVTLAIAELSSEGNRWRDFQVRATYRPQIAHDKIQFVREGVIQLIGPMDMRSQIALRGIFSKTFSRNRPWEVSPGFLQREERLADLTVTQIVLENGWLGFAIGPRPTLAAVNPQGGFSHSASRN